MYSYSYNLIYSDEFNSSSIDLSRWLVVDGYEGRLPGVTRPSQVSVSNGALQMKLDIGENGFYWTPAIISWDSMLYGRFEVRAKMAETVAVQAFWLYGIYPDKDLEIDIFEVAPAAQQLGNSVHTNYHMVTKSYDGNGAHVMDPEDHLLPNFDPTAWHVYRLDWEPNEIRWYVDGQLVRSMKNETFHDPMHMILSSEVHANWLGLPDNEELPATMMVDYVRVWSYIDYHEFS